MTASDINSAAALAILVLTYVGVAAAFPASVSIAPESRSWAARR